MTGVDVRTRTEQSAEPSQDPELVDAFITASRALVGVAVRSVAASPVAITVPQHRALVLIASEEASSVTALRAHLGINQSNASRLVDRLHRMGLVIRKRSATDARSVDIRLSRLGRSTLDAVTHKRREEVASILATMAERDRADALRAIRAFDAAAREMTDADWPLEEPDSR